MNTFQKFYNYIKGVIGKMFSRNTIQSALNIDIAISSDMVNAMELFEKIYTNEAPWLKERQVESLELGASIANEFARLTTLEMQSEVTGSARADYLNSVYKEMLKNLNEKLEVGNAMGGLIFKPYVKNQKIYIDFVKPSCFYPTEFNSSKEIIAGIFVSQLTKGKYIYTRLEYHKFYEIARDDEVSYTIKNVVYRSDTTSVLGTQIKLEDVAEWKSLSPVTNIKYITKPLFAYYKVPGANNIDIESPLGVSVYTKAIKLIKDADIQYGRIDWEYEASEKAIYVDEEAARKGKGKINFFVNRLKDRLYKKLDTGKSDFFEDYSPEIRDEAFWRGFNKILQRIEFNVGLAYGTLSDPNYVDKTATEIKASKQRSYATVSQMQKNLQTALEHLIYAINVLCSLYNLALEGDYQVSFNWDDSLVVDAEKEQTLQMQEVGQGLRSKIKYIMYRYGLTEEQAKKELEIINQERMKSQEAFGIISKDFEE